MNSSEYPSEEVIITNFFVTNIITLWFNTGRKHFAHCIKNFKKKNKFYVHHCT